MYCTGGGLGGEGINHCPDGKTSPEGSDSSDDCKSTGSNTGGNGNGQGGPTDIVTYTATFNANGGTLNGSSSKSCTTTGSSCNISSLPTASKDGYIFNGWDTNSSCTSGNKSTVTLGQNTTYYACYTNSYTNNGTSNNNGNNNENVSNNPGTGEITIALVWFAGLFAIAYAVYYFKQVKQN